jgi:tetratricopeptide (TPR) repeat protein
VALNPVYPAAYTNLGSATLALGDAHNAARWHALACALTGFRDPSSLNNLGAALEADGRLDEAQMAFEGALEVQDASAVLHLNRGNILRKLGRLSEAVSSYTRSLEIEPDGADAATAYNNVAAALQAEGNLERAMQAYDAALDLAPAHPTAAANRDKLPISPAYRDAAARESRILASRAARVLLATHAAARRRGGRAASDAAPPLSPVLHRLTRYLRRLETKQLPDDSLGSDLWNGRAGDMPSAMGTSSSSTEDGSRFTVGAFAWGGVWYHTLAATFTHPQARLALSKPGATAVVLGSSIGFEAYFAALTFAIPTVGVELLCSLTRISTDVGRAHAVPASLARFECADALSFRLPHSAAFVYVDDTAWDAPTIRQLAAKLGRELPSGAIVVHNSQVGYEDTSAERFLKLQDYEVGTSWNPRHKVYVHSVV